MSNKSVWKKAAKYYSLTLLGEEDREAFEIAGYMLQIRGCSKNTPVFDLFDLVQKTRRMHDKPAGSHFLMAECVEAVGNILSYGFKSTKTSLSPENSLEVLKSCSDEEFESIVLDEAKAIRKCN